MLVNSVLMIVISVFDNSEQCFDSILMMVNSVLKIVNLVLVFTKVKVPARFIHQTLFTFRLS